jgi:hypothetical protein
MFGDLKSANRIKISHELMKLGFGKAHMLRICENIRKIDFVTFLYILVLGDMQKYKRGFMDTYLYGFMSDF